MSRQVDPNPIDELVTQAIYGTWFPMNPTIYRWPREFKVYEGQLVMTFAGEYTDRWEWVIEFPDGSIQGRIVGTKLTDPGVCAECQAPTVEDYLCGACRDNLQA